VIRVPAMPRRWLGTVLAGLSLLVACTEQVAGSGTAAGDLALPGSPGTGGESTPTPSPSPTQRTGTCPGAAVPTRSGPLSARILQSSPNGLARNEQVSGPLTLMGLVAASPKPAEMKEALDTAHFTRGYQNAWSKGEIGMPGSTSDFVTIYEFEDSAGACAFLEWERRTYALKPVSALSAPGAVGVSTGTGGSSGLRTSTYAAVKGRFVVSSGVVLYSRVDTAARGMDLFRRQYPRV
jgi:hypothetical protein